MPSPGSPPSPPDRAAPADTVVRVVRRFRLVFNAVRSHFRQVEKLAGVGGAQLWALGVVAQRPGLGMGELAAALDVHQSTASNLVKSLVAQGLVQAVRTGVDRRAVQLHPLPAGADVLERAPGPFAGVLPQALAALDAATLARLDADLSRLIAVLGADARGAGIPLAEMLGSQQDATARQAVPPPDASVVAPDR